MKKVIVITGASRGIDAATAQLAAARLRSPGEYVDYAASKGAVDTFTIGLAREVAAEGIRVNAERPGISYTDPAAGDKGVSLFLVEADRPGFKKGRKLDKIGQNEAGTAELFFDDVRVPAANLLGALNKGFIHLMQELTQERFIIAIGAASTMEAMSVPRKRGVHRRRSLKGG